MKAHEGSSEPLVLLNVQFSSYLDFRLVALSTTFTTKLPLRYAAGNMVAAALAEDG